jgi:predicted Rossmann fold nucleotide-binding protein DprA/Smf involved in DNA uptake
MILILLSTYLSPSDEVKPFTPKQWNPIAYKLQEKGLEPEFLYGRNVEELQGQLDMDEKTAYEIRHLLSYEDGVKHALQRFRNLGIEVLTRVDADYPQRFLQKLKGSAPLTLFYAGEPLLLGQPGIAVVGSRNLDPAGEDCAAFVGQACGLSGLVLYSGGARGVDSISMQAALDARGTAVGLLADSLVKAARGGYYRKALQTGDLCLATPYSPDAGFTVAGAMGRNRLIYTLADYAIVVASDAHKGGTWAGATETLKQAWTPVFALEHAHMPEGNRLLIEKGATPFPHPFPEHYLRLPAWLEEHASSAPTKPTQLGLL